MQEENPDHSVNMANSDTLKSQKADKQHQRKIHVYAKNEQKKKIKKRKYISDLYSKCNNSLKLLIPMITINIFLYNSFDNNCIPALKILKFTLCIYWEYFYRSLGCLQLTSSSCDIRVYFWVARQCQINCECKFCGALSCFIQKCVSLVLFTVQTVLFPKISSFEFVLHQDKQSIN